MGKFCFVFLAGLFLIAPPIHALQCSVIFESKITADPYINMDPELVVSFRGVENLRERYFQSNGDPSYHLSLQTVLIHMPHIGLSFDQAQFLAAQLLSGEKQNISTIDIISPWLKHYKSKI